MGPDNSLTAEEFFEVESFRHLSNHVFRSQYFHIYLSYGLIFFFKMLKTLCKFRKRNEKFTKSIWFLRQLHLNWLQELLPLIGKILFIGNQHVKKQS